MSPRPFFTQGARGGIAYAAVTIGGTALLLLVGAPPWVASVAMIGAAFSGAAVASSSGRNAVEALRAICRTAHKPEDPR